MTAPTNNLLSHEQLREKIAALEAENAKLRVTVKEALTWVQVLDRHKPFDAPDMHGELVSIRLTGLCMLAEIVQPGCREMANTRFGTNWKSSVEVGNLSGDGMPAFLVKHS